MKTENNRDSEKYREFSRYAGSERRAARAEARRDAEKKRNRTVIVALILVLLAIAAVLLYLYRDRLPSIKIGKEVNQSMTEAAGEPDTETEPETEAPETEVPFEPHCVESTAPANMMQFTEIEYNGDLISSADYHPWYDFDFGYGERYTDAEGIVSFRGDNFRNSPAYGIAEMKQDTFQGLWTQQTGALSYGDAVWTGSGWTGQPLMMKWPAETKAHMNMYDWAKEDDYLVEVIYACMDGYIYFLDLRTGKATRDALYLGYTFKGAGALDPRGYPILYVGAGYDSYQGKARVFIINLLDCSVMYTFGNEDPFSMRGALSFFDSSALVDAASDTLIYPGENGILYLMKLNTQYDQAGGTLSISPGDTVKWRYYGNRSSMENFWLGMEDSAAVYGKYMFIADNGGYLMCLNLNTLELVWVQDILDDSNSTPVLSVEDGHLYLYVSTSFHLGWRSTYQAQIPIWKIDAETGEIVWQTEYTCYTEDGVSGGVQSTIAVGEHSLSDYIYCTVARTGDMYAGVLTCLNKKTGEIVWEHKGFYAWSSPVCVYNSDGSGRVLYCTCEGLLYLLDAERGKVLYSYSLSEGAIEASPAVYNDYLVIGTRAGTILGLKLY